jgi:hypothetical protein
VLAALDVSDVVVAKAPGWSAYGWLAHQHDLRVVLDNKDVVVYRNTEVVRAAYAPRASIEVRDWGAVLALSARAPLVDYRISVAHARPGPLVAPRRIPAALAPIAVEAPTATPVRQPLQLDAATSRIVLATTPAAPGWQLPGYRAGAQFGVTLAFTDAGGPQSGTVAATFAPNGVVRTSDQLGFVLALACLLVLAFALGVSYRRRGDADSRRSRTDPR